MKRRSVIIALVLVVLAAIACGQASPEPVVPSEPPTSVQPTSSPAPTEQLEQLTPQQIAAGAAAYDKHCARCHGSNLTDGFSPKLARSALARYGTAQELFSFLQQSMPKGNGGSLSEQEYYDIVGYLLSRQELLGPGQIVGRESAAGIVLSE